VLQGNVAAHPQHYMAIIQMPVIATLTVLYSTNSKFWRQSSKCHNTSLCVRFPVIKLSIHVVQSRLAPVKVCERFRRKNVPTVANCRWNSDSLYSFGHNSCLLRSKHAFDSS
jgi:hypothetical protein